MVVDAGESLEGTHNTQCNFTPTLGEPRDWLSLLLPRPEMVLPETDLLLRREEEARLVAEEEEDGGGVTPLPIPIGTGRVMGEEDEEERLGGEVEVKDVSGAKEEGLFDRGRLESFERLEGLEDVKDNLRRWREFLVRPPRGETLRRSTTDRICS